MGWISRLTALRASVVILVSLAAGCDDGEVDGSRASGADRFNLSIETGSGSQRFRVELALTPAEQARGLMFRERMAGDAGMLFVHPTPHVVTMWMKNTFIPLDMLFIDGAGSITHIAERTVPHSEAVISSGGPVIAVLELNAGTASRLKIRPGDKVRSKALGSR